MHLKITLDLSHRRPNSRAPIPHRREEMQLATRYLPNVSSRCDGTGNYRARPGTTGKRMNMFPKGDTYKPLPTITLPVPKVGGDCGISGNPTPGPKYFRIPILGFAEAGGVFIPRCPPQKKINNHTRVHSCLLKQITITIYE